MKLTSFITSWWQSRENNSREIQRELNRIHDALLSAFDQKWAMRESTDHGKLRIDLAYFTGLRGKIGEKVATVIAQEIYPNEFLFTIGDFFGSTQSVMLWRHTKYYQLRNKHGDNESIVTLPTIVREYVHQFHNPDSVKTKVSTVF